MTWILRPIGTTPNGKWFTLQPGSFTIGRSEENDIVIDYDAVSRSHARIELQELAGRIQDLDSSNGTYVNDRRVQTAVVGDGDRIGIGQEMLFQLKITAEQHASPLFSQRHPIPNQQSSLNAHRPVATGASPTTRNRSGNTAWIISIIFLLLLIGAAVRLLTQAAIRGNNQRVCPVADAKHDLPAVHSVEHARLLQQRQDAARRSALAVASDEAFRRRLKSTADLCSSASRYLEPADMGIQNICSVFNRVNDNVIGRKVLEKAGLSQMPDQWEQARRLLSGVTEQVVRVGAISGGLNTRLDMYIQSRADSDLQAAGQLAFKALHQVDQVVDLLDRSRRGLNSGLEVIHRVCDVLPSSMTKTAAKLRWLAEPVGEAIAYIQRLEAAVNVDRNRLQTLRECGAVITTHGLPE